MEDTENRTNNKSVHFPNAMCFQNFQRGKAKYALDANKEIETFYYLVESHSPYQRFVINALQKEECEKLGQLQFNCIESKIKDNIDSLKQQIKGLPKEWTIVHLTPFPNIIECYNLLPNTYYTNPLFISVFTGGNDREDDIIVQTVKAPTNKCGNHINLHQAFEELLQSFKTLLHKKNWHDLKYVNNRNFKTYPEIRMYLDSQLKFFINQLSTDYLREWKCFLTSSFENEADNVLLSTKLEDFLNYHKMQDLSQRNKNVLKYIFRSASHLSSIELRRALNATCKPFKLNSSFYNDFITCSNNLNCSNLSRNPLILILDEKLELYPWEMMPILQGVPVTRMPSLHFTHSLYAHHKARIVDGYLTGINFDNGSYLINPGLDLPAMQQRMSSFMTFWVPQWVGIVGRKPTDDEFKGMLQKADIFIYNGHGDGCQFMSGDSIKYLHIKSVVFLFGCGSVRYRSNGPLCAMYSTLLHYLSACCPCLFGMLYDVADKDCDLITTSLLSMWIPSSAPSKWADTDQMGWLSSRTKSIEFLPSKDRVIRGISEEPNLLLALAKIKQNSSHSYFIRSSFVVRGLPIR